MRGLSLGTSMILDRGWHVAFRGQDELSICDEGKRPGTWIDTIERGVVRQVECFSKSAAGAREWHSASAKMIPHPWLPRSNRTHRPCYAPDNTHKMS